MRTNNRSLTPTLSEVIQTVIDATLIDLHVCIPATVVEYDPDTQYADVQISLKIKYEDGTLINWPVIPNVPVVHPRANGGKTYIHIPLKKDDQLTLVVSERSLDNWKTQGGIQDPDDRRKFNMTDAYALIGGAAEPDAFSVDDPDAIEITNKSGMFQIKDNGDTIVTTDKTHIQINNDGTINIGESVNTGDIKIKNKSTEVDILGNGKINIGTSSSDDINITTESNSIQILKGGKINIGNSSSDDIQLTNSGNSLQVLNSGTINLGMSPAHAVGLADMIKNHFDAIENYITSFVGSDYGSHIHPTTAPGAPTGPPLVPASPFMPDSSTIGSSKVMVVT